MPIVALALLVVAMIYATFPAPIAGQPYTRDWSGCGVPMNPTPQDYRDCQEWQVEKRAMRERGER